MTSTPSRSSTPAPSAPSRLTLRPSLTPSPSLSNLRVTSINAGNSTVATDSNHIARESPPPILSMPSIKLDSSSSSVMNLDLGEPSFVKDVDDESDFVETEDINVMATLTNSPATDEESRKSLRDHLRRTLISPGGSTVTLSPRRGKKPAIHELSPGSATHYPPRQYFVLTNAGKPVFASDSEDGALEDSTGAMGVMQALISIFIDDKDKLRCINSGKNRITFLLRTPLYYVCSSSWGEPESVTRSHLEYLHLQILSIVTGEHLRKIFEKRSNFDLRQLLGGSEVFLTSMLKRLEFNLAMTTSSLHCLRMDPVVRRKIADLMVPHKMKDILYVMLVACGRVVTLIRPRKHSIHPADIHLLLNTIHSPSIMNVLAPSTWTPLCLPKFNPSGFVNAYISFLRPEEETIKVDSQSSTPQSHEIDISPLNSPVSKEDSGIAMVCISAGANFETVRGWCDSVAEKLVKDGAMDALTLHTRSGQMDYSVAELGVPGLRHFMYKSRKQVQITFPTFEDPYHDIQARKRLTTLYQIIHDAIHAKSGQAEPLHLQYIRTEHECVMGWITQPFELYVTLSPRLPKSAAVGAANAVTRWVKKEEARLFLKDAPVF